MVDSSQPTGWHLVVGQDFAPTAEMIRAALELADSQCAPFRRSRQATTFLLHAPSGAAAEDLFVKHFDPPAGWQRLKSWFRQSRPRQTERITASLSAAGFLVPPILFHGVHPESRREVVVTLRAEGDGPIWALRGLAGSLAAKRAVLKALGTEVGWLHKAGFIHGDLTPFNLRIALGEPPRFAFIDNERTRRSPLIGRGRRRIRNLVQLGHFALPGITRTDRVRVFRAYEAALYGHHSASRERRLAAMLQRRATRDMDL